MRFLPTRPLALALLVPALLGAGIADAQQRPAARTTAAASPRATLLTSVEGVTEYSLPNGLRVLLVPDESKPTVTVNITYLVGSRHEGYGETGMAHLLEHLVFKGTPKHPDIPAELTARGSRPNGTTWYDRTNYYETVPATEDNLTWALDLEADRMVNSFISKKDLESEFSVVRNEFESGENNPIGVTLQRTMSTAYIWHNYGKSTIGARSDIENVPIERLQAFYRRYYQPDNAILVVAGKFEPEKTLRIIEQKFGAIPKPVRSLDRGNLLYPTYTAEPTQDGERMVTVERVGDAQALLAAYHLPSGGHPDFAPADVMTRVLGASPTGRIYKALVDTKLAANTGTLNFQLKEPGIFIALAQVRQAQSLDSARHAMVDVLDKFASTDVTSEEVERAKAEILRELQQTLNTSERVGFALTEWAAMGDWRLMFLHRDRVEQVTPAAVKRVAAAYLKPSNRTIGMFVPTATPDRAEIPESPDVVAMLRDYKGRAVVQAGEAFDATPEAIMGRLDRSRLPNGMEVSFLPKKTRAERVVAQVVLRYGTEQMLQDKALTSQMLGSMLSRGTESLTRAQFRDSLDRMKATVNLFAGSNAITARIEAANATLLPALALVAEALKAPRLDSAEFESMKQQRLVALEQAKSDPQQLALVAFNRRITPAAKGHPNYVYSAEEQAQIISATTLADVRAFHRSFVGASAGDLTIVGDFDTTAVRAAAVRHFGSWQLPQPFVRVARPAAPTDSSMMVIETPDKPNAILFAGHNIAMRDDHRDFAAVTLGNFMLGGGFLNSRLATRIRQREGISYGVGSGLSISSLDTSGIFQVYAIYAPENAGRVVSAMHEELHKALTEGFTAEEIAAAKSGYLQSREQGRSNDDELLTLLTNRRYSGRTLAYDAELDAALARLTPDEVNAAIRRHIDPSKLVIVRAGDFQKSAVTP
ncbi:MAG: insulinase family protein [Gemmatimonadaceae bacterium]|nr:insulinase family protein [Gemmatimonadaceae bacterium]